MQDSIPGPFLPGVGILASSQHSNLMTSGILNTAAIMNQDLHQSDNMSAMLNDYQHL